MNASGIETRTEPDLIAAAVEALTAAAHGTRIIGRGTPNEHREPVDFAEIACQIIAAVAANVGGVEMMLAGRPGSWEADCLRQIVHSTAGQDEAELLRFRTAPVLLVVDVEDIFRDFGLEQMWHHERQHAIKHEREDSLTEGLAIKASALVDAIDDLWDQDQVIYRAAYAATVRQALITRGLACGVEIVEPSMAVSPAWDPFADELDAAARVSTPLPMTGQTPEWTEGAPVEALRRAGLTYTERAWEIVR